jgi:hypothetical protein
MLAGLPLVASGAAALAAVVLALSAVAAFRGPVPAAAEILPANCGPTVGAAAASIRIRSVPPRPKDGDVLAYKVGASYPAPANGIGCTVFDVDIFIKMPGASDFLFVCNIPSLVSGSGTVECTRTSSYIVRAADRTSSGDLIAVVHVMGNKHDRVEDCVFETSPRNSANIDPCFDASAISRIAEENTPTATAIPTATPVPADTPVPDSAPPEVNVVLPAVRPNPAAVNVGEIALPDTGAPDSGARPTWFITAMALASGGIALAGAGRLLKGRRHG